MCDESEEQISSVHDPGIDELYIQGRAQSLEICDSFETRDN